MIHSSNTRYDIFVVALLSLIIIHYMTLQTLRTPIYILIIDENPITAAHNTNNTFALIEYT